MNVYSLNDRILGCLIGAGAGDSMGAATVPAHMHERGDVLHISPYDQADISASLPS